MMENFNDYENYGYQGSGLASALQQELPTNNLSGIAKIKV